MAKPEIEFEVPGGSWEPAAGGAPGLWEQVLSADPDTGAYTRLLRFEAGADSSPNGVQRHDFWEEVFIVSGDLTDLRLGRTFTGGMYACRPPGMEHGPWRSKAGALMVEFRYGLEHTGAEEG